MTYPGTNCPLFSGQPNFQARVLQKLLRLFSGKSPAKAIAQVLPTSKFLQNVSLDSKKVPKLMQLHVHKSFRLRFRLKGRVLQYLK